MSSGLQANPQAARALVMGLRNPEAVEGQQAAGRPELTQRQQQLQWMWNFYSCKAYQNRAFDWDGSPAVGKVEHEQIASRQMTPPGFVDQGGAMAPMKFRKPTAPYFLVRAIVNKFTGMLFSSKRHPQPKVLDDPKTEDWLQGFCDDTHLWSRMLDARRYGGSMGSFGLGFRFVRGKPVVEVHDPRWCEIDYEDRDTGELRRFEKRYAYQAIVKDRDTDQRVQAWFWYRRVITRTKDSVWEKVPVQADGVDPIWSDYPPHERAHGFDFVPVVWIQNMSGEEGQDGWSDVEGVHELQEAIDALQSQAHKGTISNCDPTTVMSSDEEDEFGGEVRKGSGHGIQLEKGGTVQYLEMTGSGVDAAMKLVDRYREEALEVSRCVLDANFDGPARTEDEVEANYSSMVECADQLREQYGQGLQRLFEMVLQAVRMMDKAKPVERDGNVTVMRQKVHITPRVDGDETVPREIGNGRIVRLHWPEYRQHSLEDMGKAVTATVAAVQGNLIDLETGTRTVAPYFHVEDVNAVVKKAAEEKKAAEADIMAQLAGGVAPPEEQAAG